MGLGIIFNKVLFFNGWVIKFNFGNIGMFIIVGFLERDKWLYFLKFG